MPQPTPQMLERLALRAEHIDRLARESISRRRTFPDWDLLFPWWRKPAEVRLLMYADGRVTFTAEFGGLHYVKALMQSREYFFVDFRITTAHRTRPEGPNTGADRGPVTLTDLNILENFDVIWFFNDDAMTPIPDEDKRVLEQFMETPAGSNVPKRGGVLLTGDHNNLGQSIGLNVKRGGAMRRWDTAALGDERLSTLVVGSVPNQFPDTLESDDRPQTIELTPFPFGPALGFKRDLRPHPVMCGPEGPIDVFPDHEHEGATLEPSPNGNGDWPTKTLNGKDYQESPYIIAKGETKDPGVKKTKFGIVSAYDGHTMDVGRIVADSSWHHWFDLNLNGFDTTPEGKAALDKIVYYFLNCGVWLAPPEKQDEMCKAAWWSILWTTPIMQTGVDAPLWYLGEQAIAALGQYASRCAVTGWILNSAFNKRIPIPTLEKMFAKVQLSNLAFEQFIAGGILHQLMLQVGPSNPERPFPFEAPSDEELGRAIDDGVEEGINALKSQLERETDFVSELAANNFQL
jgi:hypothetical protein